MSMSGQVVPGAVKGENVLVARAQDMQGELRAAVTAVLPMVLRGDESVESARSALAVLGLGSGTDRELAILAGAVQAAKAFVLLGECLNADPEVVWSAYVAEAA
jgi:hypothetical protein